MISIIIPVYNTSKYLPQCIESCINQSYRDIELILVNDKSTDNSLSIGREYACKDKRIRIIDKKENEGVEKARYSGLKLAKGEYLTFVDSDDWLCNPNILAVMRQKIEETNADIVEVGTQRVMDSHGWIKHISAQPVVGGVNLTNDFEKYYISFFGVNILSVTMWGKLYRKSVVDKVDPRPMGLAMGEDLAFNLLLFPHLKSMYFIDEVGYSYRFGGMTSKYNKWLLPNLKQLYLLKKQLIEQYHYIKAADYIRIELKNVFWGDICQQIIYQLGNKEDICRNISKELSDSIYNDLQDVNEHPNFFNDSFVQAMLRKEASSIYEIALSKVKKERFLRIAKRIASYILRYI